METTKTHCAVAAQMVEQARSDRREGFVAGRYEARYFEAKAAWGVVRTDDEGFVMGGALGPFTALEAGKKASQLNARSAALLNHADNEA